jgi:hypothetical protein
MAGPDFNPEETEVPPSLAQRARQVLKGQRWLSVLAFLIVLATLAMLLLAVYRQRDVLFSYDWHINVTVLLVIVVLHGVTLLVGTANWVQIYHRLGPKFSFSKHLRYYSISQASRRLPGTIWYIASRAMFYQQQGVSARLTSLASGLEYGVMTLAGFLLAILFALPILNYYHVSWVWMALAVLATGLILHPAVNRRIFTWLKVDQQGFSSKDLLIWTVSYMFNWLLGGTYLFLVINVIYPLPLAQFGFVMGCYIAVVTITRLMIFFPSNMGVTEIGFSVLLAQVMPAPIAIIIALLLRIIATSLDIVYAAVWAVLPYGR